MNKIKASKSIKPLMPRHLPDNFIREVSPNDSMYNADILCYFYWGEWALNAVQRILDEIGKKDVGSILDLPAGHGRALRFFRGAFPKASLTACDIDRDGVDFCVKTFGAKGVYSSKNPADILVEEKFDLIWCGSLLTHLDQDKWRKFIKFFNEHLETNGVVIFTTHGDCIVNYLRDRRESLGLDIETGKRILEEYDTNGFGYADYQGSDDYGVSISSTEWVINLLAEFPNLRLVEPDTKGWGSTIYHQDTFACIRLD